MRNVFLLSMLVLCICFVSCLAVSAADLPAGRVLFDSDRETLTLVGQAAEDARLEVAPAPGKVAQASGLPFNRVYRVSVFRQPGQTYHIQLVKRLEASLIAGHTVMYTGYVRAIQSEDETQEGKVGCVVEQAGEPYSKEVHQQITARGQWQPFHLPFRVRYDHRQTGSQLALRVGFAPQVIEIGGVRLIDLGPGVALQSLPRTKLTYRGHEPDAPWRKAAADRIERYRKGDLSIRVVDAEGRPIRGAAVRARMLRHAFGFGCVYNPRRITGSQADDPDSVIYRQKFVELFNIAVDEWSMKWPAWEEPQSRQVALDSFAWIEAQGIPVRGHTMVWPSWRRTPPGLSSLADDPAALRKRVADHIVSVGSAFAGRVIDWDVVNEPYANNDILKILGREVMVEWFELAHQADPRATLYLNEAGVPNSPPSAEQYDVLERDVQMLLDHGAPLGGIGMQGHFGQHLNSPDELLEIYDRFAKFGLPIKITELDIDHPDEQIQADYLRDFMTVSFSHPSIEGILLWGFWEGQHWRPQAALFRKDWSLRPVGQAWLDLVYGAWWTDVEGITGDDGVFATRGFLGEYEVVAKRDGASAVKRLSLDAAGATVTLVIQ